MLTCHSPSSLSLRYTGEGMDEMEFTEAESNMNDLVSEYQQYQVRALSSLPLFSPPSFPPSFSTLLFFPLIQSFDSRVR